jgi:hypothetical protein
MISAEKLIYLKTQLEGDLFADNVQRVLYATDASQYREMPLAVTRPKSKEKTLKKSSLLPAKTALRLFRAEQVLHWPDRLVDPESWLIFRNT